METISKTFNFQNLKFHAPFCLVISGQSGSGKTNLLIKFIQNQKDLIEPIPQSILYCYGQYNKAIPILQKLGTIVHAGIPSEETLQSLKKPTLLLLDDLMLALINKRNLLADWFSKKSHHENISIVFIVQNLFEKNLKIVRDNAQYIILLNSPSAALQIRTLGQQIFPGNLNYFLSAYKQAVSDKTFGYLLIDLHPISNQALRLRTNIFKEEEFQSVFIQS